MDAKFLKHLTHVYDLFLYLVKETKEKRSFHFFSLMVLKEYEQEERE